MSTAPVRSYMPISEQVTAVNGLVTQPWFRFFQTMAGTADASIAANIPLLRNQVNSMLTSISTLQSQMALVQSDIIDLIDQNAAQDDELSMALVPIPLPQQKVEVLPEIDNVAERSVLAQRMTDLEYWSL